VRLLRSLSDRTFLSLRVRNFRLYFVGQLISISGTWMQSLAQGTLVVYVLKASPIDLGITVALPFLPMLLFGPFGGIVVDRSDKRRILYLTQSASGLLALALGILVSTHHVSLPVIWTLASLLGVVNLFDNPARQSFVQEMVGRELLPNAVSLNSALINLGRVVGPAIAAIIFVLVNIEACFFVNAASYAAVIVALALMDASQIARIRTVRHAKHQIRDGLAYAWADRQLREVLATVTVVGTFAFNFTVMLPLFTHGSLHAPKTDFAYLTCALGLGGLLGGLFVAHRSRPTRSLLVALGVAFGVLMCAVALAPTVLVACVALVPMGAASLAFVSTANATLQLNSREEMRGRVMALYAMGFLGTTPIGALAVSAITSATSARVGLGVGALATLLATAYLAASARERRALVVPATPAVAGT
jgi:MFS family permease